MPFTPKKKVVERSRLQKRALFTRKDNAVEEKLILHPSPEKGLKRPKKWGLLCCCPRAEGTEPAGPQFPHPNCRGFGDPQQGAGSFALGRAGRWVARGGGRLPLPLPAVVGLSFAKTEAN